MDINKDLKLKKKKVKKFDFTKTLSVSSVGTSTMDIKEWNKLLDNFSKKLTLK